MTELDTQALRQALKAPMDPAAPVDVTQIMARGRRLRNRRRLAAVAGALCAIAPLPGTGTAIANLSAAPSPRVQPAGPAGHRPAQHQSPPVESPTPHPVGRPTPHVPATPVPIATAAPATAKPSPSGSPTLATTSTPPLGATSLPTPMARPTSIAAAATPVPALRP
jgi:hypothetical protein